MANLVLDGLEQHIRSVVKSSEKTNFVRYADDFIVTAHSKDVLENKVKPAIGEFLRERGLELSKEKTTIVHIDEGFDFLGFNIRKYGGKLLIKPARKNVHLFLDKIRRLIKENATAPTDILIKRLNTRIRGWANYYRHVVSKKVFNNVDHQIFDALWRWAERRHPNKSKGWIREKYFRKQGLRSWIFSVQDISQRRGKTTLDLMKASSVPIKRHIKIRANANPFNQDDRVYFEQRRSRHKVNPRDSGVEIRQHPTF